MGTTALSLNEVETLAAKAVRGGGAEWGAAEDLAQAARWLAARGLDWSSALLDLLEDGARGERLRGALAAADRAAGSRAGEGWTTRSCDAVWLVSLMAVALHGSTLAWTLTGVQRRWRLGPDGASSDAAWTDVAALAPQIVAIGVEGEASPLAYRQSPLSRRSIVPSTACRTLEGFAARTYVPASTRSRAGAGGGRVDDD